jgi:hypothetical protein
MSGPAGGFGQDDDWSSSGGPAFASGGATFTFNFGDLNSDTKTGFFSPDFYSTHEDKFAEMTQNDVDNYYRTSRAGSLALTEAIVKGGPQRLYTCKKGVLVTVVNGKKLDLDKDEFTVKRFYYCVAMTALKKKLTPVLNPLASFMFSEETLDMFPLLNIYCCKGMEFMFHKAPVLVTAICLYKAVNCDQLRLNQGKQKQNTLEADMAKQISELVTQYTADRKTQFLPWLKDNKAEVRKQYDLFGPFKGTKGTAGKLLKGYEALKLLGILEDAR